MRDESLAVLHSIAGAAVFQSAVHDGLYQGGVLILGAVHVVAGVAVFHKSRVDLHGDVRESEAAVARRGLELRPYVENLSVVGDAVARVALSLI